MTHVRNLKKSGELISCEGQILVLRKHRNRLFLESFLKDGSGYVFFPVTAENLLKYVDKKITLNEAYKANPEPLVFFKKGREIEAKSYLQLEFDGRLQCGEAFFEECSSNGILKRKDVVEIIASL